MGGDIPVHALPTQDKTILCVTTGSDLLQGDGVFKAPMGHQAPFFLRVCVKGTCPRPRRREKRGRASFPAMHGARQACGNDPTLMYPHLGQVLAVRTPEWVQPPH